MQFIAHRSLEKCISNLEAQNQKKDTFSKAITNIVLYQTKDERWGFEIERPFAYTTGSFNRIDDARTEINFNIYFTRRAMIFIALMVFMYIAVDLILIKTYPNWIFEIWAFGLITFEWFKMHNIIRGLGNG